MMLRFEFLGEKKANSGTGVSRALRRENKIPAVIYGLGKNHSISLDFKTFLKEYQKGGISSKLINIKLGKETLKVIPREVQIDPITDNPIHIDFQLISDDFPIKVAVLVKVINGDKSPGIKKGGILNIVKKFINLKCIPKNIPAFLQIDISGFEIGTNVNIKDIELPNGVVTTDESNCTVLTIASGKVEEKEEEDKTQDNVIDESK